MVITCRLYLCSCHRIAECWVCRAPSRSRPAAPTWAPWRRARRPRAPRQRALAGGVSRAPAARPPRTPRGMSALVSTLPDRRRRYPPGNNDITTKKPLLASPVNDSNCPRIVRHVQISFDLCVLKKYLIFRAATSHTRLSGGYIHNPLAWLLKHVVDRMRIGRNEISGTYCWANCSWSKRRVNGRHCSCSERLVNGRQGSWSAWRVNRRQGSWSKWRVNRRQGSWSY